MNCAVRTFVLVVSVCAGCGCSIAPEAGSSEVDDGLALASCGGSDSCPAPSRCVTLMGGRRVCARTGSCSLSRECPTAYVCREQQCVQVAPGADSYSCPVGSIEGLVACGSAFEAHVVSDTPLCSICDTAVAPDGGAGDAPSDAGTDDGSTDPGTEQSPTFYVDFVGGNDLNDGRSATSPFQHCPGDGNARDQAAATRLQPGNIVAFKRGVTYEGQITMRSSGVLLMSGTSARVTATGSLVDTAANFNTTRVDRGDYVYIYNRSTTGAWIETVGLWRVDARPSSTELVLSGFDGVPYDRPEVTYRVFRPISFTATSTWGTGEATLSGSRARDVIFDLDGQSFVRIAHLRLTGLRTRRGDGCAIPDQYGAVWDNASNDGIVVDGCTIESSISGVRADGMRYSVIRNNTVRGFDRIGLTGGDYALVEGNLLQDGISSIRACGPYSVIRFNRLLDNNNNYCGAHSDGIGPFFSGAATPNANQYGWIYGNVISNTVMGIFLSHNNRGTANWTIHSNVLIGHYGAGGSGAYAISIGDAENTRIYNNTIVGLNGSSGWINAVSITESPGCDVRNNIVYSRTSSASGFGTQDAMSTSGFGAQGNFYFSPERATPLGISRMPHTWVQWNAAGYDTIGGSFGVDPQFVDIAGTRESDIDLRLQPSSPARGSPHRLPGLHRDAARQLRPASGPWDRGAYHRPP